jgi:acyl-CoA thioesterase
VNLSLGDLALTPDKSATATGRYHRVVGGGWTFAGRVFGGYTAGLAVAAARRESPHPTALAAHIVFLEAARPGLLEVAVTELRGGRRTWAGRSVVSQHGRPVVTCDTWFGDRGPLPPVPPGGESNAATAAAADLSGMRDPLSGPSLSWLLGIYPCVGFLEERAIDYPADPQESGGPQRVELWARPALPIGEDPFIAQILDLMLADAHLIDAAMRPAGLTAGLAVSLDLAVTWGRPGVAAGGDGGPASGWLHLAAEAGPPDDGFTACTGTIRAQDGTLRATALQQGRVLPGSYYG